ncbi:hypothetical protein EON67_00160, partial [archaeon]
MLVAMADGSLYAAGDASKGACGVPLPDAARCARGTWSLKATNIRQLTRVPNVDGVLSVAVGRCHSLAADGGHRVWAWGTSRHGALGIFQDAPGTHTAAQAASLQLVSYAPAPTPLTWVAHALSSDGCDSAAAAPASSAAPLSPHPPRVAQLFAGWECSGMRTSDGRVITFGSNRFGACGTHAPASKPLLPGSVADLPPDVALPGRVALPHVTHVATGWHHMLALTAASHEEGMHTGTANAPVVYSWGRARFGQLGRPVAAGREHAAPLALRSSAAGTTPRCHSAATPPTTAHATEFDAQPAPIVLPFGCVPQRIAAGAEHSVIVCRCASSDVVRDSAAKESSRAAPSAEEERMGTPSSVRSRVFGCGWNEHGNLGVSPHTVPYYPPHPPLPAHCGPSGDEGNAWWVRIPLPHSVRDVHD